MSRRDAVEVPNVVSVEHVCRPPRWMARAILAMTAALLATLVGLGVGAVYVYQANQYVQGRGEFRDREAERTNQRINDAICDLLDQLPEGGLLDRPREKYGCGPGIPIADLSPEEREQLAGRGRAAVVPPPPATPPPVTELSPMSGANAFPNPPRKPANEPPQRDAPAPDPSPEPGPLVDLEPVTEPVCEALRVCA